MPIPITLSSNSSPPATVPTPVLLDQQTAWQTDIIAAGLRAKLFNNNVVVTASTLLSDLSEAVAPGYAPVTISTLYGPYLEGNLYSYMLSQECLFACSGGGSDMCYGGYIVEITGAAATVTFTLVSGEYTAPVITSGGSGYLVAPKITPTGATGSGAVLQAVITGGVLTGVNIINPGSGYTTVTATVEAPNKLIYAGNFPTPQPLVLPTDAIAVIFEIDQKAA